MNLTAPRPADIERDLLVATLAIESDLLAPSALLMGLHTWISDRQQPLVAILAEQRVIHADARSRLDAVVTQYIEAHQALGDNAGRRALLRRFVSLCRAVDAAQIRSSLRRQAAGSNQPVESGRPTAWERGPAWASESAAWRGPGAEPMVAPLEPPAFLCPDPPADQESARAQVYALGVVLYSLLTGQPPFVDLDATARREQVQHGDFCPPRAVQPTVSPALEALCLKAMALSPAERYVSPAALAEDLDHWLAREPMLGYPSPLSQRLRRWGRRHRHLTTLMMLLAIVFGLTAAVVLVDRARHWLARGPADQPTPNQLLTLGNPGSNELGNRWLFTRDVLAAVTTKALTEWVGEQHALSPEQRRFVEGALAYYSMFSQDGGTDPVSEAGQADAFFHMGILHQCLGDSKAAEADYEHSQRILQVLVQDLATDRVLGGELAQSHLNLGVLYQDTNKLTKAQIEFKKGLMMYGRMTLGNVSPRLRMHIAKGYRRFAAVLTKLGRRQEAELALRQAPGFVHTMALPSSPDAGIYLRELALIHDNLGTLLTADGESTEAKEQAERALTLAQGLVAAHPNEPLYHNDLAVLLDERALAALEHKDYQAARDRLDDAMTEHQAALAPQAGNTPYRSALRDHLAMRARVSLALGDSHAAAEAADGLLHLNFEPAKDAYTAARTLAGCATLSAKDQKLSAPQRQTVARRFSDRAMSALMKALAAGFNDMARLRKDQQFDALRGRADFQKLGTVATPVSSPAR